MEKGRIIYLNGVTSSGKTLVWAEPAWDFGIEDLSPAACHLRTCLR